MIAINFFLVGRTDRPFHSGLALFPACLLAVAFMALGGCSASGGGEGGTPAGSSQPAAAVTSITLVPSGVSLQMGQSQQFTATAKDANGSTIPGVPFTWTSSESLVASVSGSGLVTGLAGGGTSIRASAGGILSAPATVSVSVAPPVVTSITLTPPGASLQVGQSQQFTATAKDANGSTIAGGPFTWQSSDSAVAGVSGSGLASGVSAGSTTITASAGGVTSGAASLTVIGGGGGSYRYSTNFPVTENPISIGGTWINGHDVGLDWSNIQTTPGFAYGTQTGFNDIDDSIAILTGAWGPNQTAQATVVINGYGFRQEIELRLNNSISSHQITGYEFTYDTDGSISIARYDGAIGSVVILTSQATLPQGRLVTGDVLKATRVGSVLTAYVNGNKVAQTSDATYINGSPGLGFFLRTPSVANANFGVSSYQATD